MGVPIPERNQKFALQLNRDDDALSAPQRYDYLLIASEKNNPTILDRFDRDLIKLIPQLQSELLTFADHPSIDDGETGTGIERDRANDKCIGRNLCRGVFHIGVRDFCRRFPSDRPERITCFDFFVEGGTVFEFDRWCFFGERYPAAGQKADKEDLFHFLPMIVSAVRETC